MKFLQAVAFLETDQALAIARASEEMGFDGIAVSDHMFFAREYRAKYPYTADGAPFWKPETHWPDPWVLIGAMAAVTTRLRFTTNVYVAPARDLFTVAKAVSTAAVLSGGRVSLGAGPGWCEDEFLQTGQDFATRGKRLDEMVVALRALWAGGMVEHHGTYYDFDPVQLSPTPPGPIPILIGGDTDVALRRAARVGDGWVGNAYDEDTAAVLVERLRSERKAAGREDADFDLILSLKARPTPELFRRFEDLGVTSVITAPWMAAKEPTLGARLAAMEAFAAKVLSG